MSHANTNYNAAPSVGATSEEQAQRERCALAPGSPFFGAILHIDYQRICPSDKSGMVNIDCDGPQGWSYADVGSHHGIQISDGVDKEKTMRFCDALSKLVKEHFGDVTPLLPYNVNRHGRVPANPANEPRR